MKLATLMRFRFLLYFLPTLVAVIFYSFLAADRYVSEAQFIIRTASKPAGLGGFSAFLQMAGLSRSQDDIYSVKEFLDSRDAARLLNEKIPLKGVFGDPNADVLSKYPSIFYGDTLDQLNRYLRWMITTNYSLKTGLTTLRVQAFKPEHAKQLADALLDLGEATVNKLNQRIQADAIRTAEYEVDRAQKRLVSAQVELTTFRNSEATLDPRNSAVLITEVIAGLINESARMQTQLREATVATPDAPALPALKARLAAIESQMAAERAKISQAGGGLATKLATYERLSLDLEFAKSQLTAADRALENARNEARRQELYLERVVEPNLPDYPLAPERLRGIVTALIVNLVGFLVLWLFYAGVKERVEEHTGG